MQLFQVSFATMENGIQMDARENGHSEPMVLKEGKSAKLTLIRLQRCLAAMLNAYAGRFVNESLDVKELLKSLLTNDAVQSMLLEIAHLDVFSQSFLDEFKDSLQVLGALKQLKFFYSIPLGQLVISMADLQGGTEKSPWWTQLKNTVLQSEYCGMKTCDFFSQEGMNGAYNQFANSAEDPHAVFPTNIYRQSDGSTVANDDFSTFESVMSLTLTTTTKVRKHVLDPSEETLATIYKPLGRCVAIVDDKVAAIYRKELVCYFSHHAVDLKVLVYNGDEVDKEIENVEKILVDLKRNGVSRNEPVLIVGGGVISDIGGFACALYHRSTPYVMLCTSLVSGIDAGPSPRTCCDGFGFKNLYGAYHPPIQTITDRFFFKSLHEGWLRHGIAEMMKMGIVKDKEIFALLEKAGPRLIRTKFGTSMDVQDQEFEALCDLLIGRALNSYIEAEYGNLWETHQCRPHAFGHTWSPGYELYAGMLHGHAVASGMGFGAYLAHMEDWITKDELERIMTLISTMELTLWHPTMDEVDIVWGSQVKMVQKRGGNLCAPVPKGGIGQCGYLNDLPYEVLKSRLAGYKNLCKSYPRSGNGIEMHCEDVGLQNPSITAQHYIKLEQKSSKEAKQKTSYAEWINEVQTTRNSEWKFNVMFEAAPDTESPPKFDQVTLFHPGVEQYSMSVTSLPSDDIKTIAKATAKESLFAPCMVGTLESQFLKMQVAIARARNILDIGTFTGMSAMSMAEGIPFEDGKVVTLENDEKYADVAEECFSTSKVGHKIQLLRGNAVESMKKLIEAGETFDIIFIDADKENYIAYYDLAMSGLLSENGFIMADNALCALLYDADDERSQRLHDFNQHVKNDKRVAQTVVTLREGVSIIMPVKKN